MISSPTATLSLNKRIAAFAALGLKITNMLNKQDEELNEILQRAKIENGWFSPENTRLALQALGANLTEQNLQQWLGPYNLPANNPQAKTIGLIMAGNVPLVGFHDILCVLLTGNYVLAKLSSDDKVLIPMLINKLCEIEPLFSNYVNWADRINNCDAVIATGSNNSSRYFEYYFANKPHIIRKNRQSVAVLSGSESLEQLKDLCRDIFQYYGLGCRSVSKLFVPDGYNFQLFFNAADDFMHLAQNNKWANNYDYNKAIYLLNQDKFFDCGIFLMRENESNAAPTAVLHFEQYTDIEAVKEKLESQKEDLQCVISINQKIGIPPGSAQCPSLATYADNVDTIEFLKNLN